MLTGLKLDQLVIDSAMEKREMEHKHATIQQRVSSYFIVFIYLILDHVVPKGFPLYGNTLASLRQVFHWIL